MRSAAKLSYQQAQFAIGGRTDEDTEPLVEPVLKPLYAAYEALEARARRARPARSRSAGAQDPAQGRRHRRPRDHAGTAGGAPADRGIHDPRQCRRRRDAGKGARAADLSRARRADAWKRSTRCANSSPRSTFRSPKAACCRPDAFNRILARVKGRDAEQLVNEVVLRTQAQAEYAAENYGHFGLNLRRYAHFTSPIRRYADLIVHRGLIRALKLGADGLPEATDAEALGRDRRADFRDRAPRHAGRARDQRPADRAFPRRPHRRHLRRPHLRRHPRRPVRQAATRPAPTASCRRAPSATNISATTRPATPWSARAPARPTGSATASPSSWSKPPRLPARLRFELLSEGRTGGRTPPSQQRRDRRPTAATVPRGKQRKAR